MRNSRRHGVSLPRRVIVNALVVGAMLFALVLAPSAGAAIVFPALTGRVVDDANILSDETKSQLTAMLAQEEKQTTDQIVVVTLQSLGGNSIESYGYQLGRHWAIGQKKKDNGALIIVAPSEHKARIEVGYGLEGTLTDAATNLVINRYMLPAFKRGDYNGGVIAGTNAVLQLLGGVTLSPPQYSSEEQDQSRSHGFPLGFIVIILIWVVFGRFLWPLFFLNALGGGRRGGWGGGGFGGGFGGGGFGGGGFSGGGGGFGGGGSSGSW